MAEKVIPEIRIYKTFMAAYLEHVGIAAHADLPWEQLDNCNILVTGATGLIGSCLVEVLLSHKDANYQVYASGRNEESWRKLFSRFDNDTRLHFLRHDLLAPLSSDIDFHYIIHAASDASPNYFVSNPVEVMKANILGVEHLAEYGIRHHLKRMLYVSSGEVYGEGDGRVFTEEYSGYVDCTKPRSCYPSSKRAAETLCVAYGAEYGIDTVIARPSHTYGPHFRPSDNRVYAQFINNVIDGNDIVMKSNGLQYRSWCYVVDCVSALLHILLQGEKGQAYNIADETSNITIRQLGKMTATLGGCRLVMEVPDQQEKAGYNVVTKSTFSTSKLRDLGWRILPWCMEQKMQATIDEARRFRQSDC